MDKFKHFWTKWPFYPCEPNDPRWCSRPLGFVEGVKLMYLHESHDEVDVYLGGNAFLVKMTFLPAWPQMM